MKAKKIITGVLFLIFLGIFCVSLFNVVSLLMESKKNKDKFANLALIVESSGSVDAGDAGDSAGKDEDVDKTSAQRLTDRTPFLELDAMNPDFEAWITIPDTVINYPVMWTPQSPQYYLRKDFDRNYALCGTPFMDARCEMDDQFKIIYGHRMNDGSMFRCLLEFEDYDYCREHRFITLETVDKTLKYEIVAAFKTSIPQDTDGGGFSCYEYVGNFDEEGFDAFVEGVKRCCSFPEVDQLTYGDHVLMLSTCSYHVTDGRFLVVAREIERKE